MLGRWEAALQRDNLAIQELAQRFDAQYCLTCIERGMRVWMTNWDETDVTIAKIGDTIPEAACMEHTAETCKARPRMTREMVT